MQETSTSHSASPQWGTARVVAREAIPGGLVALRLAVPRELGATYAIPGQYVTISVGEHQASFVLAGDPGSDVWEVIVRPPGRVTSALTADDAGEVRISHALGRGFPLESIRGKALAIAVVGSAIAVGRALVRARIDAGDGANTRLYVGVRTRADIPLTTEIDAWVTRGCGVVACLSRETATDDLDRAKLRLATGYVHHSLGKDLAIAPAESIFAAGPRAMVDTLRDLASELSMDRRAVVTNH